MTTARSATIDLTIDEQAFVEFALMESRKQATEDVEASRNAEEFSKQAEEGSEVNNATRRLATADRLVKMLAKATSVTLTMPEEDHE